MKACCWRRGAAKRGAPASRVRRVWARSCGGMWCVSVLGWESVGVSNGVPVRRRLRAGEEGQPAQPQGSAMARCTPTVCAADGYESQNSSRQGGNQTRSTKQVTATRQLQRWRNVPGRWREAGGTPHRSMGRHPETRCHPPACSGGDSGDISGNAGGGSSSISRAQQHAARVLTTQAPGTHRGNLACRQAGKQRQQAGRRAGRRPPRQGCAGSRVSSQVEAVLVVNKVDVAPGNALPRILLLLTLQAQRQAGRERERERR